MSILASRINKSSQMFSNSLSDKLNQKATSLFNNLAERISKQPLASKIPRNCIVEKDKFSTYVLTIAGAELLCLSIIPVSSFKQSLARRVMCCFIIALLTTLSQRICNQFRRKQFNQHFVFIGSLGIIFCLATVGFEWEDSAVLLTEILSLFHFMIIYSRINYICAWNRLLLIGVVGVCVASRILEQIPAFQQKDFELFQTGRNVFLHFCTAAMLFCNAHLPWNGLDDDEKSIIKLIQSLEVDALIVHVETFEVLYESKGVLSLLSLESVCDIKTFLETNVLKRDFELVDFNFPLNFLIRSPNPTNSSIIEVRANKLTHDSNLLLICPKKTGSEVEEMQKGGSLSDKRKIRWLLKNLSHECRTPLNCCQSLIDCALSDLEVPDSISDKYLRKTNISLRLLDSHINNMADLLKIECNELESKTETFKIADLITEAFELLEPKAFEKGLQLIKNVTPRTESSFITNDLGKLKRILLSLITDSIKHSSKGQIILKVLRKESSSGPAFSFIVEDSRNSDIISGCLNNWAGDNPEEEDLGTRIAKHLCNIVSGGLKIEKKDLNDGLRFCFEVSAHSFIKFHSKSYNIFSKPLAKESEQTDLILEDERAGQSNSHKWEKRFSVPSIPVSNFHFMENLLSPKSSFQTFNNPRGRVMLVDDDPFNIYSIEMILKRKNISTVRANNGFDAINILKAPENKDIACVFMDLNMPEMSGCECTRIIMDLAKKGEIPEVKIIGCSANDSFDDIKSALDSGMSDFVAKPLSKASIEKILSKL